MDLVMVHRLNRTVDNINSELNAALDTMGIEQCVLLVHSISGVYGLNFVQNYPEKVKGFIAVDNTVYDEELAEAMEMEKKYMLQGIDEFQKIKNSFFFFGRISDGTESRSGEIWSSITTGFRVHLYGD